MNIDYSKTITNKSILPIFFKLMSGNNLGGRKKHFNYDPLVPLISSKSESILYFTKRDLLKEEPKPLDTLAILRLKKQKIYSTFSAI